MDYRYFVLNLSQGDKNAIGWTNQFVGIFYLTFGKMPYPFLQEEQDIYKAFHCA